MKPQDIFGKYTAYFALTYAFLKIFFDEQGTGHIQPSDELQETTPMVQKNPIRTGETRNEPRERRSRETKQPIRNASPEYSEELHRDN